MAKHYSIRQLPADERGMSIAAVLLIISLLAFNMYLFTSSFVSITGKRGSIWGRDVISEIEDTLRNSLGEELGHYVESLDAPSECNATAGTRFNAIDWSQVSGQFNLSHLATMTPSYTGPSDHEEAKTRCQSSQTFDPTAGGSLDAKHGFYVCFQLDYKNAAERGLNSIFRDPPVFVEVRYNFWNFSAADDNQTLDCASFRSVDQRGGQIFYTVYWQKVTSSKTEYFRHSGVVFVPSHR